jgi:hypothetical protein
MVTRREGWPQTFTHEVRPNLRDPSRRYPTRSDRAERRAGREGNSLVHLAQVRKLSSLVSSEHRDIACHHLTSGVAFWERGLGQKATDRWALPLTHTEHEQAHQAPADVERSESREQFRRWGRFAEFAWFLSRGANPFAYCRDMWLASQQGHSLSEVHTSYKLKVSLAQSAMRQYGVWLVGARPLGIYLEGLTLNEWSTVEPLLLYQTLAKTAKAKGKG